MKHLRDFLARASGPAMALTLLVLAAVLGLAACASPVAAKPAGFPDGPPAQPDPNTLIFLMIGQSNMEGVAPAAAEDRVADPRVQVLAYTNSPGQGRRADQWYTAVPPLHNPGSGLGPGDWFGKTLAAGLDPRYKIGLVPCGIAGVDIDFFLKGVVSSRRHEFRIPPDNHWDGAYEWVLGRAKHAARYGRIAGIIFHQGESDAGKEAWIGKVGTMLADLKADLGLGDIPFLVGEVLYFGPCRIHNPIINRLPEVLPNTHVISAKGLFGMDQWHFETEAVRELGRRYGQEMLKLLTLD